MSNIYIFSGLGVDERVFEKIDFSGLDVQFIEWIPPLKNEALEAYAERISKKIVGSKPVLIGLSFGGMLAVEIAKRISVRRLILIASAKCKYEIPAIYRILGKLKLHRLIPSVLLKRSNFISNWLFGVESEADKRLLKKILRETDAAFLKWAIQEIVHWRNMKTPENVFSIHGSKDRILPIRYAKPDVTIADGGHFMTVNKHEEIEKILRDVLS